MNEFRWIAEALSPLAVEPGAFKLTDDAALIQVPHNYNLVISTDASTSGVHFLKSAPPGCMATKSLLSALSDIIAKGAVPYGYFMNIFIPQDHSFSWLAEFVQGLQKIQSHYHISLLGGDTSSTLGPFAVDYTVLGYVKQDKMIKRSTAQAGDLVYITGDIGDSFLGLQILLNQLSLKADDAQHLIDKHYAPKLHLELMKRTKHLWTAAIDISDGFLADLNHLLQQSHLSISLHIDRIPFSARGKDQIKKTPEVFWKLLTGGEDYELILSIHPSQQENFEACAQKTGTSVTLIGHFLAQQEHPFYTPSGQPLTLPKHQGYVHF